MLFLNSHDKVTYNLMVTKREGPWPASLRSRHATSHDKAALHPRRHQTVSSSEHESMAYASDEHCTSSRAAPQPLTQYPKPGGTSFINVLTPVWSPLRSAPSWSLSAAARDKGWGQAPSHPPIPSVSAALLHFPLCGITGGPGKCKEGKGRLQWGKKSRRSGRRGCHHS